jgi:hypothetical protein
MERIDVLGNGADSNKVQRKKSGKADTLNQQDCDADEVTTGCLDNEARKN